MFMTPFKSINGLSQVMPFKLSFNLRSNKLHHKRHYLQAKPSQARPSQMKQLNERTLMIAGRIQKQKQIQNSLNAAQWK